MSIESWVEEFYPIEASEDMSDKTAIKHGLLKFQGATTKNLCKHKVDLYDGVIISKKEIDDEYIEGFSFDDKSCALCLKYLNNACIGCPIYDKTGGTCSSNDSPYIHFCDEDDPSYMLEVLEELLKDE